MFTIVGGVVIVAIVSGVRTWLKRREEQRAEAAAAAVPSPTDGASP
jgi:uncharacterized iron-regulated membrane protein